MVNDKSRSQIIVSIIGAGLVIIALAIFISIRLSTGPKPVISSLLLQDSILVINPEDESLNLTYCIAKTPSPSNCEWVQSRELELSGEGTYYIFAKNLDTGALSDPTPFELPPSDFTN